MALVMLASRQRRLKHNVTDRNWVHVPRAGTTFYQSPSEEEEPRPRQRRSRIEAQWETVPPKRGSLGSACAAAAGGRVAPRGDGT